MINVVKGRCKDTAREYDIKRVSNFLFLWKRELLRNTKFRISNISGGPSDYTLRLGRSRSHFHRGSKNHVSNF